MCHLQSGRARSGATVADALLLEHRPAPPFPVDRARPPDHHHDSLSLLASLRAYSIFFAFSLIVTGALDPFRSPKYNPREPVKLLPGIGLASTSNLYAFPACAFIITVGSGPGTSMFTDTVTPTGISNETRYVP